MKRIIFAVLLSVASQGALAQSTYQALKDSVERICRLHAKLAMTEAYILGENPNETLPTVPDPIYRETQILIRLGKYNGPDAYDMAYERCQEKYIDRLLSNGDL